MDNANRWYFTKEQLENSPSRKCGIDPSKELSYRQQAANFIQDMGQRLHVTQLCINTAIVYMHRFYVFHSFSRLHRNQLAVAALFLAAKVEEQPRKLEHVVRVAHKCLHRGEDLDPKTEPFMLKCSELVFHENMMLQTLGFDIAIDHPHTYVVKLLQLVKDSPVHYEVYMQVARGVRFAVKPVNGRSLQNVAAGERMTIESCADSLMRATKDLAQTSYFMATNSLHLTTMCLQYRPTVVACVCIHLACKWSDWKIEPCSEGKEWYYYVDKNVTPGLLEDLTKDFLAVLEKSPNRLKRRVGPENSKDQSAQFKPGDEIVTRMDSLQYDDCMDPPKPTLSPVPSTSSCASVVVKEEKMEKPCEASTSSVPDAPQYGSPPPAKKPKIETPHSIPLSVYMERMSSYREKRTTQRSSGVKPPLPATVAAGAVATPMELPLPSIDRTAGEEKVTIKQEPMSNEVVPKNLVDIKSGLKRLLTSYNTESTSGDKVNHLTKKAPTVPAPKNSMTNDTVKAASKSIKGNDPPYVLLTRLDQTSLPKRVAESKVGHHAQSIKVSKLTVDAKRLPEVRPTNHPALPVNACDSKNAAKATDLPSASSSSRPKHSKQKAVALQNSHIDAQLISQGNLSNQNPAWDIGHTNGSSVLPSVDNRVQHLPHPSDSAKTVERNIDSQIKHKKKDKHRHKQHPVHSSSKDMVSNHNSSTPPDSSLSGGGGIKITIPKDKIVLSGAHQDQKHAVSDSSPRTRLKIKIPKPKSVEIPVVKPNPPSSGLKLVITKDKNAGSYSAKKAEKASRKRDRSPSSKDHNSRSSVKQHKNSDHNTNQVARIPTNESAGAPAAEARNCVPWNAVDGMYYQNNVGQPQQQQQPPYVIQPNVYNSQLYYQQPYYNYSIPTTNMQYGHMPPPMPQPPPSGPPPLPRDPPPPQPPLPSE